MKQTDSKYWYKFLETWKQYTTISIFDETIRGNIRQIVIYEEFDLYSRLFLNELLDVFKDDSLLVVKTEGSYNNGLWEFKLEKEGLPIIIFQHQDEYEIK